MFQPNTNTSTNTNTRRSVRPALMGLSTVTAIAAVVLFAPLAANAADPGDDDFLGTAEEFAIVAGDTVTDTATHGTVVIGDVGLTPGTDQQLLVTQVVGDIHVNDIAADTADLDVNTAYVILANTAATETVGTANLAARATPYGAGVYFSGSDLLLDGTISLTGGADDVFVFQASTGGLTVTSGSVVQRIGGVQACNVYWQVGSSAVLGTNSQFVGTIVAATSISAQQGAQVTGQLLAAATNAGAVTLDDNFINNGSTCVRATESERLAIEALAAEALAAGALAAGASAGSGGSGASGPALLAETGVETSPTLTVAALLMLLGVGAVIASRRTRPAIA